jgi:hypothetical protein
LTFDKNASLKNNSEGFSWRYSMSKKRIVLAALSTAMAAGTLVTTKIPDAAAQINAAARDALMSRVVPAKSTEANVRLAAEAQKKPSSKERKSGRGAGPFDKAAPPFHLFAAGPSFVKGPRPLKS